VSGRGDLGDVRAALDGRRLARRAGALLHEAFLLVAVFEGQVGDRALFADRAVDEEGIAAAGAEDQAVDLHLGSLTPDEPVADLALTLPKNSRISDVLSSGSRIVVRVRLADGAERLYALDGTTLRPLNSLTIQVEK